ncbi:hypothetical protein ACFQY5_16230 [Paeniroseomonas aquatica]|uniref:hypothetical protein n=1 Tax=Paeniroseomonas aquatica TaxID=373043 RepID=UPI0036203B4C
MQLYTPVNEMYVTALFSARYGWWNEQMASDRGFVTALKHLAKANVLAMEAILEVRPDAIFIQSDPRSISTPTARPPSARPRSATPSASCRWT